MRSLVSANFEHRLSLSLVILAVLAGCTSSPADPDDASAPDAETPEGDAGPPPLDPRFEALAAAIESDIARSNATGASVAVWLDEEIIWVGGFGTADPEGARRPDENTLFMIGSDTKKIAAIMFLQRVAAGEIAVDATLADVLPDLQLERAPELPSVTAHELLTHQTGLVDGLGPSSSSTTDDVLRSYTYGTFARRAVAMAPHGLFFNYCNPGFALAGLMTETLGETAWADLARRDVFEPLEMTRTFARKSEVDANHAAGVGVSRPTDTTVGPVPLEATWEDAFVRPAGLVWSTPSDQMRLARFLVDGDERVLPAALLASLHQRHVPLHADLPGQHYGYGLFLSDGVSLGTDYRALEVWSHGGNTLTHTSTFYVLPEQRFAISILSNGRGDDFTNSVVTAIRTLVDLPAPTTPPEPPLDPAAIDALVGTYVDPTNVGTVIVTRDGSRLAIDMPDLDAARVPYQRTVTPISTRAWRASIQGQPLILEIYDGPSGELYMVHRAFVAVRSAPEPSPTLAVRARPSRETILRALRRAELEPTPSLFPHAR